jgi:hypothetical protein
LNDLPQVEDSVDSHRIFLGYSLSLLRGDLTAVIVGRIIIIVIGLSSVFLSLLTRLVIFLFYKATQGLEGYEQALI